MRLSFASTFLPQFEKELGEHGNTLDLSDNKLGLKELLLKACFCFIPTQVVFLKLNNNDLSLISSCILASAFEGLSRKTEFLRSFGPLFLKELHLDNNNFFRLSKDELELLFKSIPKGVEILSLKYNKLTTELLLEACPALPESVMQIFIDDNTMIKRFTGVFKCVRITKEHDKGKNALELKASSPISGSIRALPGLPASMPSSVLGNSPTTDLRSSEFRRPIEALSLSSPAITATPPSSLSIDVSLNSTTSSASSSSLSVPSIDLSHHRPAFGRRSTIGRTGIEHLSHSLTSSSSPDSSSHSPWSHPHFGRRSDCSITKADSPASESGGPRSTLRVPLGMSPFTLLSYLPPRASEETLPDTLRDQKKLS